MNSNNKPKTQVQSFDFYSKLKEDKSSNIRKTIKAFIDIHFNQIIKDNNDVNTISAFLQDFISKLTKDFAAEWQIEFYTDKDLYITIINCFENIIFKSLYSKLIALFDDIEIDYPHILFVSLSNLGVDTSKDNNDKHRDSLANQIKLLNRLSDYITPKDKMAIITNICNYINITYANYDRIKLTKCLMFIIIHSEAVNLKAQLVYCSLFRHKSVLNSDEDYFLSIAIQAVNLVIKLNHKNVAMTKEEFDEKKKSIWKNDILLRNGDGDGDDDDDKGKGINLGSIDNVLNIPIEELYKKYCVIEDPNTIPISQYEKLRNDMKIILKLIESTK